MDNDRISAAPKAAATGLLLFLGLLGSLFIFAVVMGLSVVRHDSSTRIALRALRHGVYPWPHLLERLTGMPDLLFFGLMAVQFLVYAVCIQLGRRAGASRGVMVSIVAALHLLGLVAFL